MKNFLAFTTFFFTANAHAFPHVVVDATPDTTVSQEPAELVLQIRQASALKLFDGLQVPATPGTEDVLTSSKSAAGLYCYSEGTAPGRTASCEIHLSFDKGIEGAVGQGQANGILAVKGDAASTIYRSLTAAAQPYPYESDSEQKKAPGITCLSEQSGATYSCTILLDVSQGILR